MAGSTRLRQFLVAYVGLGGLALCLALVAGCALQTDAATGFADVTDDAVQTMYTFGAPHTEWSGKVTTDYDEQTSFFPRGIYYTEPCRDSRPFLWPAFTDTSHEAWTAFDETDDDKKYFIRLHMGTGPQAIGTDSLIFEYRVPAGTPSGTQSFTIDKIPTGVTFYYEVYPWPWLAFVLKGPLASGTFELSCAPSDADDPNVVQTLAKADFNTLLSTGSSSAKIQHPQIYIDLKEDAAVQDFVFVMNGGYFCFNFPYQLVDPVSQGGQGYGQHSDIMGWQLDDEPLHAQIWDFQNDCHPEEQVIDCSSSGMQAALDFIQTKYDAVEPDTDQAIFAVMASAPGDNDRQVWPLACDEETITSFWEQFIDVGDVASHDNYLSWNVPGVPYDSTILIAQSVAHQTRELTQPKPSWFTVYAASFEHLNCGGGQCGYPSAARTRAAVYTAIVHGATGIWYFGWDSFLIHPGIRPPGQIPPSYPEQGPVPTVSSSLRQDGEKLWLEIADINEGLAELDSLGVLLQPTRSNYKVFVPKNNVLGMRGSCLADCSPIHTMMKISPTTGKRYVFAVNMEDYPVDLELRFPQSILGKVDKLDPSNPLGGSGNVLTDQLGPFGVSVYELTLELDPDGLYEINHEYDDGPGLRRCMGALGVLGGSAEMHVYCYTDEEDFIINPQSYPDFDGGDGQLGAPPPGPDIDPAPNRVDLIYGDVDIPHAVLSGSYNSVTNTVSISGCFVDEEDTDRDVYVEWDWNLQTGVGLGLEGSKMWEGQCTPTGPADEGRLQVSKLASTGQHVAGGLFGDSDGDGVPDYRELQNESACGFRDPFNPNDYYDVSIPRDGIVDLFNDIVGVINNYWPRGYTSGDAARVGLGTMENYDRPSPMIQGAGPWNRGSPDYIIDLFNDIVGVIGQYNPLGCPE